MTKNLILLLFVFYKWRSIGDNVWEKYKLNFSLTQLLRLITNLLMTAHLRKNVTITGVPLRKSFFAPLRIHKPSTSASTSASGVTLWNV